MKKRTLTRIIVLLSVFSTLMTVLSLANTIPEPTPVKDGKITTLAGTIIGIVQFIGMAVAVAMLIWYGVRYFTSEPSKQAELKKAFWGYLIGAICIFGAVIILNFVKGFVEENLKDVH